MTRSIPLPIADPPSADVRQIHRAAVRAIWSRRRARSALIRQRYQRRVSREFLRRLRAAGILVDATGEIEASHEE